MMECLNECVEMVQKQLKDKSVDYLWGQYNPYEKQTEEQIKEKYDIQSINRSRMLEYKRLVGI